MREATFGEKAVGLSFNPSGDQDVQTVKELYAKIIDMLLLDSREKPATDMQFRIAEKAIDEAMTAQMWAVKAITCKE